MIKSSFFNSIIDPSGIPDRPFDANDFCRYFKTLIGNGVFPNPSSNFQVFENQNDMSIKVQKGVAYIEGHLAYDDSVNILNIDTADSVQNRIDRVVLRLDTLERKIKLTVKKGSLSAHPTAPSLQRDADGYEICLAEIRVNNGAFQITQADITDTRMNSDICGWVTGTVRQIDTSTLFNQLERWKSDYINTTNNWTQGEQNSFVHWKTQFEYDSQNWKENQANIFSQWKEQEKNNFNKWFSTIQGQLSGDVAGNLANRITDVEKKLNNMSLTASNVSINNIIGLTGSNVQRALEFLTREYSTLKQNYENLKNEISGYSTRLNRANSEIESQIGRKI